VIIIGKDLKGRSLGVGLSQRKDGRYEARAMINGFKICIYNMNLSQLKKEFELEKAKVLRKEKNIRPNLTLKEWFEEWFSTYKAKSLKSEVSKKAYHRKVSNTYIAAIGDKKIENISHMNMQDATNELLNKFKARTLREALGVLRECLDIAVMNQIIKSNPCINIAIKDENEAVQERRVLSSREMKMFLDEIEHEYYNEAYQILLLTGMRIGEFSGLQWQDINWQNKTIRIQRSLSIGYVDGKKMEYLTTPKTSNSYRTIPFFGNVGELFKDWKVKQDQYKAKLGSRWRLRPELGDLVFTTTLGSPVTRYALSHNIEKVLKNINEKEEYNAAIEGRAPEKMEHIYPHAFRHTFATRCFEKKLDPVFIQRIMGHTSYATTLKYTHLLETKLNEEVAKAEDFLL
jgi:integrase